VTCCRLVAQSLSNKAIAAKLHLSVRTVESHVRHTLAKTRLVNPHAARDLGARADSMVNPRPGRERAHQRPLSLYGLHLSNGR
jgi:Bacterial regulatory proteins, luxR family